MFAPCTYVRCQYLISPGEVVSLQDVHVDVPGVHVGRLVGGGGGEGEACQVSPELPPVQGKRVQTMLGVPHTPQGAPVI